MDPTEKPATLQIIGPRQEMWLQALESGKYKQGKEYLQTVDDEFCCLGIACHLVKDELKLIVDKVPRPKSLVYAYETGATGGMPEIVRNYFGFRTGLGDSSVTSAFEYKSLAHLNDTSGLTLQEIAAHVRKNPRVYFKEPK